MKGSVILCLFVVISNISLSQETNVISGKASSRSISDLPGGIFTLKYSTLIGGSEWDYGHGIAVDESGCAYVAGQANSSDYPATIKSFDNSHNGNSDILLTKLNRDGSALLPSTFIGGSGRDDTRKVFLDKSGFVYLTGSTESPDYGAFTQGKFNIIVTKLKPDGRFYHTQWCRYR